MFARDYHYKTRYADKGLIKTSQTEAPSKDLIANSFRQRAMTDYNSLPLDIRNKTSINKFKVRAKKWIQKNTCTK